MVILIVAAPVWMLRDDLTGFALIGDDFAYISEARDWPTTRAHLLEPHNTHVVPVFRLWTAALVAMTGRLGSLQVAMAAGSYLGLVAAMAAVGLLIARETGRTAIALAAMAALGLSTVTHPAVTWYSAGQALWAGTAIVATVILARGWALKGGAVRLASAAGSALLAPAIWSGGLVAGPAAIAYLARKHPPRARRAAMALAAMTAVAALVILGLSRDRIRETPMVWERHHDLWPRPVQAMLHTAQAMVEAGILGNLGLDAVTAPWQAVGLLVAVAVVHAWSRGGLGRLGPLEAAGATIAVGGCLTVYLFRGNLPYSSLRSLGWYHAIPQVGVILFVAGWCAAVPGPARGRMTLGQAAGVLGFVLLFAAIQVPRAQNRLLEAAPALTPTEAEQIRPPELRALRALVYKHEFHERQLRALMRLDKVDGLLARWSASPDSLRDLFGRILLPGIPDLQIPTDAFTMLRPRPRNPQADHLLRANQATLGDLLRPEPELGHLRIERTPAGGRDKG